MARTRAPPPEHGPQTKRQKLDADQAEKEKRSKEIDDMNETWTPMLSEANQLVKDEEAAAAALALAEEEEKAALDLELQKNDHE